MITGISGFSFFLSKNAPFRAPFPKNTSFALDGAGSNSATARNGAKSALETRFLIKNDVESAQFRLVREKRVVAKQATAIAGDVAECVF